MLKVRFGQRSDIARLQEIERDAAARFLQVGMPEIADNPPSSGDLLVSRIDCGWLLAVETTVNRADGFIMFRAEAGWLYVEELDVTPALSGRRFGALLLDAAEEAATSRGLRGLLLSTFITVPWNAPYYRRCGFRAIADDALTPEMRAIRRQHESWGLDETQRVFMCRFCRRHN